MDWFRDKRWDLVGLSWLWYTISVAIMVVGVPWWITRGLNLGIDFTGGAILKYKFEQPLQGAPNGELGAMARARAAAADLGYRDSQVQVADVNWLIIRITEHDSDRQTEAQRTLRAGLEKRFGDSCGKIVEASDVEFVGPVVGEDLRRGARTALVLGIALIIIWVSIRYKFRFAIAAVLALIHDVLVLCGIMAILHLPLESSFVAAVLTVLGYSNHDTIVIFDRIRENMALHRQAPFASTVNASLLQTMARSVNTVLTVLFTLVALAVFGGATIKPFAIALIIGICSGCYSSIFTASQLLVSWQRMWEEGAGDKLWWRALLAIAPAAALGVFVYPGLARLGVPMTFAGPRIVGDFAVAIVLWAIGLFLTRYFSVGALRVLAGVPASKGGVSARAAVGRPVVASASVRAAAEAARGGAGPSQMEAASAAAAEERREERRERREQRKTKERRRPGDRKKRF